MRGHPVLCSMQRMLHMVPWYQSIMECKRCGSDLTKIEYRSRSADEAHSSSYRCPFCPLYVSKFFLKRKDPRVYLSGRPTRQKMTPVVCMPSPRLCKVLSVSSKNIGQFASMDKEVARSSSALDEMSRLYKIYSTGRWQGKAIT